MSVPVEVPALGESITEAIVAEWVKNEGDFVEEDEILVELETDKITVSVPAPVAGVLKTRKADLDETVEVGDVIAEIEPGERSEPEEEEAGEEEAEQEASKDEGEAAENEKKAEPSSKKGDKAESLSPAVRRLIEEHDLNPRDISGSGPGGRILKGDVLDHIEKGGKPADRGAPAPSMSLGEEPEERVKMSRLRQTVAKRLVEAQQEAAMLTTFNEVDMSAVMELRRRYKSDFVDRYDVKLGFMSFFVKACINALKEYPAVNAEIDGDEIVYKNYYHIGVAVGGPKGLVVPVVRHADQMSFADVEKEIGRLAGKVQQNRVTLDELQGGTFTISNGGIYGSMLSTPILNPPQVGILGMHNIVERPVVVDGEVVVRPIMYLALSYDHRIIDGKEAVSFLYRVKECIEDPERILLEI
jgi:2-oxoglutarate dehydrogenase E2 component (dihydrolipoamide succinyltransferase)